MGEIPHHYDYNTDIFIKKYKRYINLPLACLELHCNHLFTQENFTTFNTHQSPEDFASVLIILAHENILTEGNFNKVKEQKNLFALAFILATLQKNKDLNQEKFDEITANSDSDLFEKISPLLVAKQRTRSLTLERYIVNSNVMITDRNEFFRAERYHLEHGYLACMLYHLQEATILTQNNFKLILEHTALYNLAYLSDVLFKANLLTEANFAMVANHQHPDDLCELFDMLSCYKYKYTTLTQEDLQCIVEHPDLKDVISKVESLHSMHQLTKDSLRLVIGQQNKLRIAPEITSYS